MYIYIYYLHLVIPHIEGRSPSIPEACINRGLKVRCMPVLYPLCTLMIQVSSNENKWFHWRSGNNQSDGSSVPVVSRWLSPDNRTFLEVHSVVVTWWIVAFVHCLFFKKISPMTHESVLFFLKLVISK